MSDARTGAGKGKGPGIGRLLDFILAPAVIAWLAWEPNHAHGFLNYNESGQYLSAVGELQRGSLLFRDLFAQYGPLQYYGPLWFFGLFGSSIASLRLFLLVGEIASLIAAYALARVVIPKRGFAWLAGLAIVIESHHPFWSTRWGGFRFAFIYLSLLALVMAGRATAERRAWWLALAGSMAGVAFLHTYDAGLIAGVGAAVYFVHAWVLRARSESLALLAPSLGFYFAGALAALLPFLVFLVATGTLADYLSQLPLLNPGRAWLQTIRPEDWKPIIFAPAVIYAASALVLGARFRRRRWQAQRDSSLLILTCCGALLYLISFRAIQGPQFETSLPLAIVTACQLISQAFVFFVESRSRPERRGAAWGAAAAVGLSLAAFLMLDIRSYGGGPMSWATHQLVKGDVVARFVGTVPLDESFRALALERGGEARLPDWQADEIEGVTRHLEERLGPDEVLFAYPDLGIFNYLVDRPHLTRFTIPVLADADPAWASEILEALETSPPAYILLGSELSTLARATQRESEYLPEVRLHLTEHYKLEARVGRIWIMARRESD